MEKGLKEMKGDENGNVKTVILSDGTELNADIVVVGAGITPTTGFLGETL